MDGTTRDELVIEASAVVALIEQAQMCQDCGSYRMLHVGPDQNGDLDLNIVIAHDDTCPAFGGML